MSFIVWRTLTKGIHIFGNSGLSIGDNCRNICIRMVCNKFSIYCNRFMYIWKCIHMSCNMFSYICILGWQCVHILIYLKRYERALNIFHLKPAYHGYSFHGLYINIIYHVLLIPTSFNIKHYVPYIMESINLF